MISKKAPVVRVPGLKIDVNTVNGGARMSAMPPVNGHPQTLAGSVRGAKPEIADPPSGTVKRRPMTKVVRAVLRTTRESW